jgi:hypothetical protein
VILKTCGDCGAAIGELHVLGCDVERCPMCGHQAISCDCIYEFNGMDPDNLEDDHPEVYENGPTEEMYAKWDAEWGHRRMTWTGIYPGDVECHEFGWFAKLVPDRGWVRCGPDDPEAHEDLNRLVMEAEWDATKGRFVKVDR